MTHLKEALEKLRNLEHNFGITGNQTENSAVCLLNASLGVTALTLMSHCNSGRQKTQETRCVYVLNVETLRAHSTEVAVNNVWSKEKLEMSTKTNQIISSHMKFFPGGKARG